DRADSGARECQGARGRLSRSRTDHPRTSDDVGGADGSRTRRRRLADPRLIPKNSSQSGKRGGFQISSRPMTDRATQASEPALKGEVPTIELDRLERTH